MQRRPSVVYIRRRCCCKRRTLRCCTVFALTLILLLCLEVRLMSCLIWAGIATLLFRLFVIGLFI